jgi:N-acetyl-anhydromuramyl-L-alanine amidase AmpD
VAPDAMKSRNKGPRREALSIKADYVAIGIQIDIKAVRYLAGLSGKPSSHFNVNAICFVIIATLDVRSRKAFHHGSSRFQRHAALNQQSNDIDRARS